MKRNALYVTSLAGLLVLLIACTPQRAQAQLGIAGGATFTSLSDVEGGTETATGYHIGVFYDLSLGPLAIRPGIFYMDVGEIEYESEGGGVENFDVQMLQAPIDVRLNIGVTPFVSPYVMAGPVFRFNASDDDGNVERQDFSVAANAGVGVEIALPGSGLRLYPEVLYTFGINEFATAQGFQGADNEARLNNILVRLGIAF